MNDYVTINDGTPLKYATVQKNWRPEIIVPGTERVLLSGNLDATFGPASFMSWSGEIVAPVTANGAGWGTLATLRTALKKRQLVTFTDHLGTAYSNCYFRGPFTERHLQPVWDAATNICYVKVQILAKA
jgi:hypothetical protein